MQNTPTLFDRSALTKHRARAATDPALFLHEASADELLERVEEVNRAFTCPAVVTGWPQIWADRLPSAAIVSDEDVLDLKPGAHDLIIHSLGLHWANDPVGQLVQCRHALRPDGMLLATLFGGETLQELRRCLAQAESQISGGLSPRIAPMGEIRDLGGLLQRAGFALPVADNAQITVTYETAMGLMKDLRAMGESNAMMDRLRKPTPRAVLLTAAQIYADTFANVDGRIPATFDIITLTGWAPGPDQPQALRPGSAKQRLSDALGALEIPLERSKQ